MVSKHCKTCISILGSHTAARRLSNLTYVSLQLANNIASYSFSSLFSIQAPVSVSSHLFTPRLHYYITKLTMELVSYIIKYPEPIIKRPHLLVIYFSPTFTWWGGDRHLVATQRERARTFAIVADGACARNAAHRFLCWARAVENRLCGCFTAELKQSDTSVQPIWDG